MSGHFATGEIWVGNLDTITEADDIADLIQSALSGAGYQATVTVTAHHYEEADQ